MTILGLVTGWATASNEQAVDNARRASTACSRRRVEREDVALFLASLAVVTDVSPETTSVPGPEGVASLSG